MGFLKKTLYDSGGGCGGPTWDGWYLRLFYGGGDPEEWKPTVADVHTDAQDGLVLEEGVGDVNFMVVAVDNQKDHMAFVGPVYSYYEFSEPASKRMTDEEWQARLTSPTVPPRPSWTAAFRAPAKQRDLAPPDHAPKEFDPRVLKRQQLEERLRKERDPKKREGIANELRDLYRQPSGTP